MRCTRCANRVPTESYALVDGIYFCLTCFLEQFGTETVCQTCANTPARSAKSTSNSKREKFGSSTSVNSVQSNKTSEAASRFDADISRGFRNLRFSSASRSSSNHAKPSRLSKTAVHSTCQVCFDEKSSKHFLPLRQHPCLQHQRTICDACIYRHIQQSFQEMCTDDLRCPELQCNTKFGSETIRSILRMNRDEKLCERYERFQVQHHLEQLDEFIWCSNPKCQMGQLNDGGSLNNIVRCIHCRKKTCFIHKTPWHEGLTCEQYDLRTNSDLKESLKWLNQNTKTCPNCPYQIEKNNGCDHMTCIKCQYEFCWSCLANYDQIRRDGNHRHHPSCKHYAFYNRH